MALSDIEIARRANKKPIIEIAKKINVDEINEVVDCLESGWLGTGPKVKKFEDDFKRYKNILRPSAIIF